MITGLLGHMLAHHAIRHCRRRCGSGGRNRRKRHSKSADDRDNEPDHTAHDTVQRLTDQCGHPDRGASRSRCPNRRYVKRGSNLRQIARLPLPTRWSCPSVSHHDLAKVESVPGSRGHRRHHVFGLRPAEPQPVSERTFESCSRDSRRSAFLSSITAEEMRDVRSRLQE